MDEPSIVFDPYAGAAQCELVEEIINRRNVRLTGHDDWYPVAFFLKTDSGEILGGLLGQIWHNGYTSPRWLCESLFAAAATVRNCSLRRSNTRSKEHALMRG